MKLGWRPGRGEPVPPQNVRVVLPDGTEVPVECVYVGQDKEGNHVWETVWTVARPPVQVFADVIPGRTLIRIAARKEPE